MNVIAEDRVGGPQMRILRMAAALKHRGVDTVVAIPQGTGAFGELLEQAGVPYHRVPWHEEAPGDGEPPLPPGLAGTYLWGSIRRLVRLIREEDIAVVHQNDVTHVQGAIAGRLAGCGVVWHINGMPYPLVWKSFKPLVSLVPHVVAASSVEMGREYMGSQGDVFYRPVEVLYPPIDVPGQAEPGTRRRVRGELGIPEGSPMIVTVGNLYPTKGHLYFVASPRTRRWSSPWATHGTRPRATFISCEPPPR